MRRGSFRGAGFPGAGKGRKQIAGQTQTKAGQDFPDQPFSSRAPRTRESQDNDQDEAQPLPDSDHDPVKVRRRAIHTAVGLLSRREHAPSEIKRKLRSRGFDDDTTSEVIDALTRQRLLSDERFAEAFIRSRAQRGQGPVRLRAELRQLEIPAELIEQRLQAVVNNGLDWVQLAAEVRSRRFGLSSSAGADSDARSRADSLGERAKQMRFLQYRGFTADQIRAALRVSPGMDEDVLLESGEDAE